MDLLANVCCTSSTALKWTAEEDALMMALLQKKHKYKWQHVQRQLLRKTGVRRSIASLRARMYRNVNGAQDVAEGRAKNRCGRCGSYVKGHTCA